MSQGDSLKILVIGSGGREHALVWKLAQSRGVKLYAWPGNPGISALAECLAAPDAVSAAEFLRPDLTIAGPEAPLVAGLADRLHSLNLPIVGPTAAAAEIERSKGFAKAVMAAAGVPTAAFEIASTPEQAREALRRFALPVVLKADGLAAGKGVIVAPTKSEAEAAIPALFRISQTIVVEEYLQGEEVSFIVLTDGRRILPLEPCQDHKAVFDGDQGPNTGGMGAYCDSRILTNSQRAGIVDTAIEPVLAQLRSLGRPFSGFLYAGLMLTADGPKVLEFNARLGDPETQPLMLRLESDLADLMEAAAHQSLPDGPLAWNPKPAVCVVLAAAGYPGAARTGDPIGGIERVRESLVFHSGTRLSDNVLQVSGGRVLGVTASASTLPGAIAAAYADVAHISFAGMHYRHDIGHKGLQRWRPAEGLGAGSPAGT